MNANNCSLATVKRFLRGLQRFIKVIEFRGVINKKWSDDFLIDLGHDFEKKKLVENSVIIHGRLKASWGVVTGLQIKGIMESDQFLR